MNQKNGSVYEEINRLSERLQSKYGGSVQDHEAFAEQLMMLHEEKANASQRMRNVLGVCGTVTVLAGIVAMYFGTTGTAFLTLFLIGMALDFLGGLKKP